MSGSTTILLENDETRVVADDLTGQARTAAAASASAAASSASAASGSATSAGNSATAAEGNATSAAISAGAAEALVGPSYATTAAGLAATTNGVFFAVSANGIVTIYLNDSGSAVAQRTLGDFVNAQNVAGANVTARLQASADLLGAEGGTVIIPPGDWSGVVPASITFASTKMVTWHDLSGTLPEGMPGMVITQGNRAQPGENSTGTSTRPGDAFVRYIVASHTPNEGVTSQQDSVLYVEGSQPSTDDAGSAEFAALRFNMTSLAFDSTAPVPGTSNRDIKGIQGVVRGSTGNSKVRSIRTTSFGIAGHYGTVTGAMVAAVRSGIKPTQLGGDGVTAYASGDAGPYLSGDAALIAQVGPGIQANIRCEGFAGKERPQIMFLQGRGNQAVLPEVSVLDLHGGGNGAILRVFNDENAGTQNVQMDKTGKLAVPAIRSSVTVNTIADDGVLTITPPAGSGIFKFWLENNINSFGEIYFRTTAGGGQGAAASGTLGSTTTLAATGTTLTGTTGIDGRLTVSVVGNTIMVENRVGAARNLGFVFMAN